jgi:hypothetical protein
MKNKNNNQLTGWLLLPENFKKNLNMKKHFLNRIKFAYMLIAWAFFIVADVSTVKAQWSSTAGLPIAYWDFENNTTRTTLETTVEQQINTGNTFDGKFGGVSTATSRRAGAGISVYGGTADGSAMRAGGWSSSSTAGTGITTYFQFTINTTGFTGIRLNFDAFPVDGGLLVAPSFGVTYSTDGGTVYTNVGSQTTFGGSWYSDNLFTLGSGANNISNLKVRIYGYWSDNSTTSTLSIDDLIITATGLSSSAGIKTTLSEPNIYTSYTSGTTGSLWIRYGTFTVTSGSTLNMGSQIFLGSSTVAGAVSVSSGGTFDCGSAGSQTLSTVASGLSTFTLNSGAAIIIRSTAGITAAGTNTGNIQLTTRTFNAAADYTYTHVSGTAMNTGTGLPAALTSGGSVTISNTNAVTLTQATAFGTGSTLILATGAFSNGALLTMNNGSTISRDVGTLSAVPTFSPTVNVIYTGTTAVNTANELPAGASNLGSLTINKTGGVTLIASPTVNGTATLTAGSLNIASNTLTLNGAITSTAGTIGGTTASNLTVAGSGAITGNISFTSGLQQLNNLTHSRSASVLTLGTVVSIGGNISSAGTITANNTVTFNQAGSVTVSGSGTTNFANIVINKSVQADIVSVQPTVFTMASSGLTITAGTFKLSTAATITPGALNIPAAGAFWNNGGTCNGTNNTATVTGLFRQSAGTTTIGTSSGNSLTYATGSVFLIEGGNLNIVGRFSRNGTNGSTTSYTQSGGTVTVVTVASTSATRAGFDISQSGSSFTMSNGTIALQNTTSNVEDIALLAGSNLITGGTIQFGNSSTPANTTFKCNIAPSLYNVTVNSTNSPNVSLVTNDLTINNILTLNGGTINTGSLVVEIPVGGSVTRTNGHINGKLYKGFNTGSGQSKTFEVGDATVYAPVQLASLNVTTAGNVTAFTNAGTNTSENIPVSNSSGINQSARANRYWTMTAAGGFIMSNANATFNFSAGEATGATASYVVRKYDPSSWATTTTGTRTSTSTQCTGLTSFSEFQVGVPNTISVASNPSSTIICDDGGTSYTVSTTSSPVPSIQWQEDNGGGFANLSNTGIYSGVTTGTLSLSSVTTAMNTYKYRAVITNINGSSNSNQATLTVNDRPTASVSGSATICDGGSSSISVSVTGSGTISGTLSPGAIPFSGTAPTISVSVSPSSNTSYSVATLADANCSSTAGDLTGSHTVNVDSRPTASVSGSTTICDGGSSSISISVTGSGTISGTLSPGAIPFSGTAPTISVSVSPSSNTSYSVATLADANCTSTAGDLTGSYTVNVTAAPTAALALAGSPDKCLGQSATVSLTFTGTGPWNYTISGSGGPYSGTTSSNPETVNVTSATAGVHNYSLTSTGNAICPTGGTTSGSATVYVSTVPPPSSGPVPAGGTEACVGSVILITSNVISGQNIIYSWNTGSNSSTVLFSTNIGGPFTAGPFQTNTNQVYVQFGALAGGQSGYQVCLQGVNGCGSSINKCLWLRGVVSGPGVITPPDGVVACENTTQLYSCGLSAGATVYNWTLNGSAAAVTPNAGNNPTNVSVVFPSGFTTGQLCVTAALACGGSSTSAPRCMTINKNPANPNVPTGAAAVCPGATGVSYSIPVVAGATGYNWIVPANATIATGTNSSSITVNFPTPYNGSSSVCVTTTSPCGASAVKCKTVSSGIPNQPAGITGPLANICGSTVQYSVVSPPGGLTYTWTNPVGTTISGSATGSTILLNVSSSFTSGVLTVAANSALCAPATSAVRTSSTVWGRPNNPGTITQYPPGPFCSGAGLTFSVVNPVVGPVPNYTWTSSNGAITSSQGPNNIDVIWGTSASGTITVKASNTCGLSAGTSSQGFTPAGCREEDNNASSATAFSVYPNPAHDKVTVSIDMNENTDFILQLTDVSGRVVLSQSLTGTEGLNTYDLNLAHLSKGIYMLEVKSAVDRWKSKVIIE